MRAIVLAGLVVAIAMASMCPARLAGADDKGWWQPAMLVDYGVIAASGATLWALSGRAPPHGSAIGPSFDPTHPAKILDPAYSNRIGRHFLAEKTGERIPASWVGAAIAPTAMWLLLQEGVPAWQSGQSGQSGALRLHETGVGLAETLGVTLATTEILKAAVGRLRPDFADRVRRYYCTQDDAAAVGIACTGQEQPLAATAAASRALLDDGRKSFPSGHSSTSFALATYAVLATGGRWVWGEQATGLSRGLGLGAQAAALGLATFVAWSRVDDGRHNLSDVLTGGAIGVAMANLAYWRRFDASGEVRRRPTGTQSWAPQTFEATPLGLSVAWQ